MVTFAVNSEKIHKAAANLKNIYIYGIPLSREVAYKSSRLEVFLEKGVLKICCKFTGEHPCQSAISMKLQSKLESNLIEITFRHRCFPVNLLYIFRIPFLKTTFGRLLLNIYHPVIALFLKILQISQNKNKKNFRLFNTNSNI